MKTLRSNRHLLLLMLPVLLMGWLLTPMSELRAESMQNVVKLADMDCCSGDDGCCCAPDKPVIEVENAVTPTIADSCCADEAPPCNDDDNACACSAKLTIHGMGPVLQLKSASLLLPLANSDHLAECRSLFTQRQVFEIFHPPTTSI
jgi:hypothetical protein